MADLLLTCPACGKQTPISEYVSEKTAACQACGKAIPVPARQRSADKGLKLRPVENATQFTPIPATWPSIGAGSGIPIASVEQKGKLSPGMQRDIRRIKVNRAMVWFSWLLFIVLAAAMYYIRFRFGLAGEALETLKMGGLIAIGISYLVIIVLALKDNMFDGLLSIVIPLYPFYYLFLIADALFMRVIVAALLVGFGYDLGLFLQETWLRAYNGVNYWIKNVNV